MSNIETYGVLLNDIKQRIRGAQYEALRAVNRELMNLYWDIGHILVSRQQGQTWGQVERQISCLGPQRGIS